MAVEQKHIELALKDDVWCLGNEVLYNLCRQYPDHKTPEVVVAKLWLIGRSYPVAVERRKNKSRDDQSENDAFYERQVAPELIKSKVDDHLARLKEFRQIDAKSIPVILETHKYLVDLFRKLTDQDKRSLASKYLHFHRPNLFYLYDTRAARGFRKLKPGCRVKQTLKGKFDEEYKTFALKLLDLHEEIKRDYDHDLTPRQIDRMLLKVA